MLKRQYRLKDRRAFNRIYRQGQVLRSKNLVLYQLPNRLDHNRLAVVVSTKISKKATTRNRLRRRLQALMWEQWGQLAIGHDILISLKADVSSVTADELRAELSESLKRSHLI